VEAQWTAALVIDRAKPMLAGDEAVAAATPASPVFDTLL
jgi:hypothetical protein